MKTAKIHFENSLRKGNLIFEFDLNTELEANYVYLIKSFINVSQLDKAEFYTKELLQHFETGDAFSWMYAYRLKLLGEVYYLQGLDEKAKTEFDKSFLYLMKLKFIDFSKYSIISTDIAFALVDNWNDYEGATKIFDKLVEHTEILESENIALEFEIKNNYVAILNGNKEYEKANKLLETIDENKLDKSDEGLKKSIYDKKSFLNRVSKLGFKNYKEWLLEYNILISEFDAKSPAIHKIDNFYQLSSNLFLKDDTDLYISLRLLWQLAIEIKDYNRAETYLISLLKLPEPDPNIGILPKCYFKYKLAVIYINRDNNLKRAIPLMESAMNEFSSFRQTHKAHYLKFKKSLLEANLRVLDNVYNNNKEVEIEEFLSEIEDFIKNNLGEDNKYFIDVLFLKLSINSGKLNEVELSKKNDLLYNICKSEDFCTEVQKQNILSLKNQIKQHQKNGKWITLYNEIAALEKRNNIENAVIKAEEAYVLAVKSYDYNNEYLKTNLQLLWGLYFKLEDYDNVEKYLNINLKLNQEYKGKDDAYNTILYYKLAYLNLNKGQYEEAKHFFDLGILNLKISDDFNIDTYFDFCVDVSGHLQKIYNDLNGAIRLLKLARQQELTPNQLKRIDEKLIEVYLSQGEKDKAYNLLSSLLNKNKNTNSDNIQRVNLFSLAAKVYANFGSYDMSLSYYTKAYNLIIEKQIETEPYVFYNILRGIGFVNNYLNNKEESIAFYKKALIESEKKWTKKSTNYALALGELGNQYIFIGDYEKALTVIKSAHVFATLYIDQKSISYAKILIYLNKIQNEKGEFKEALNTSLQAKSIFELNETINEQYIELVSDIGTLYRHLDNFEKSFENLNQSLVLAKELYGDNSLIYANQLFSLASSHSFNLDYNKALLFFKKSLNIFQNIYKEDTSAYSKVLFRMAFVYNELGDLQTSLEYYLKVENYLSQTEKQHINYCNTLSGISAILEDLGDFDKSFTYRIKATECTVTAMGLNNPETASAYLNLARAYLINNNYLKALLEIQKAKQIAIDFYGDSHTQTDFYKTEEARILYLLGDYSSAQEIYKDLLSKYKEDDYRVFNATYHLAKVYEESKQYSKAIDLFKRCELITSKNIGDNKYSYSSIQFELGSLYYQTKNFKSAVDYLKKSNTNLLDYFNDTYGFRSEKEKKMILDNNYSKRIQILQSLEFVDDNKLEEITQLNLNNQLVFKGILLNSTKNIISDLEKLNNPEISNLILNYLKTKNKINAINNFTNRNKDTLVTKANQQEVKLVKLHKKNSDQNYFFKNWINTRDQLKQKEVSIEFSHFQVHNKKWTDSTMYVAYLYKKGWKTPKVINLFEEKQLKEYLSTSSDPNKLYKTRGVITTSNKNQLAVADSIYKLVWKPLEKYVNNSSTIYFSPDGLLHKIPFAALPNEDNKLIGELYNIQQMGTTADVGTNTKQPNLEDVLLIGGVKYNYKEDTSKQKKETTYNLLESEQLLGNEINRNISKNGFAYLPGTEKEITNIKLLLPNSQQLSGYNATETAFKKLSGKSPSILHIATHGYFFPKPKEKRNINPLTTQETTYSYAVDPLLRSGLLFANANYAWQNGNNPYEEDDGILTALEISNLDLKSTDIVILSACETGLGDIEGSEGVYGLQRAFKMAGVKTIIMSLWEVPDAETAEFMNLFYGKWKIFNNSKKAFKETQQEMMDKYREVPEKWAAFVYFE